VITPDDVQSLTPETHLTNATVMFGLWLCLDALVQEARDEIHIMDVGVYSRIQEALELNESPDVDEEHFKHLFSRKWIVVPVREE